MLLWAMKISICFQKAENIQFGEEYCSFCVLLLEIVDSGERIRRCQKAAGTKMKITVTNVRSCKFPRLRFSAKHPCYLHSFLPPKFAQGDSRSTVILTPYSCYVWMFNFAQPYWPPLLVLIKVMALQVEELLLCLSVTTWTRQPVLLCIRFRLSESCISQFPIPYAAWTGRYCSLFLCWKPKFLPCFWVFLEPCLITIELK